MAAHARRGGDPANRRSYRYGLAALAVAVAVMAPGQDVAWADAGQADPTGSAVSHDGSAATRVTAGRDPAGPARRHHSQRSDASAAQQDAGADTDSTGAGGPGAASPASGAGSAHPPEKPRRTERADAGERADTGDGAEAPERRALGAPPPGAGDGMGDPAPAEPLSPAVQVGPGSGATSPADAKPVEPVGTQRESSHTPRDDKRVTDALLDGPGVPGDQPGGAQRAATTTGVANPPSPNGQSPPPVAKRSVSVPAPTGPVDAPRTALAVATSTTVDPATPITPAPLSPIAQLLELPGRIVNAVLQVLDLTVSVNGPHSPLNIAPIDELLFAAFRGLEQVFGLHQSPAVRPVVPTLTYTGPTTAQTPTVAQFLNAAASGYGLGTVPGGLQPFTVNGFQLATTNIFTGAAAKVWVTPEQQVIIAYQGTTGGTNLLFNPFIAISQLITDLQVVFGTGTPQAFSDSLEFAQRVQAEATGQGYSSDDIFVTGHSLGGWEAGYVAQQTGMAGIGFESPGLNTAVPGNGADSMFVNIATYGDTAVYFSTDLPGLQPFMPAYVPGGGSKPHYGSIVMIGDPDAVTPLLNASALIGWNPIGLLIFAIDILGNFFQHHLPGIQAYHLGISPDPGVVPWLGSRRGPVNTGWGELTIQELLREASDAGTLFQP